VVVDMEDGHLDDTAAEVAGLVASCHWDELVDNHWAVLGRAAVACWKTSEHHVGAAGTDQEDKMGIAGYFEGSCSLGHNEVAAAEEATFSCALAQLVHLL
jgi:hypothetical protein